MFANPANLSAWLMTSYGWIETWPTADVFEEEGNHKVDTSTRCAVGM